MIFLLENQLTKRGLSVSLAMCVCVSDVQQTLLVKYSDLYYSVNYSEKLFKMHFYDGWWRSTVVERRSMTGELSLSCARPAADG